MTSKGLSLKGSISAELRGQECCMLLNYPNLCPLRQGPPQPTGPLPPGLHSEPQVPQGGEHMQGTLPTQLSCSSSPSLFLPAPPPHAAHTSAQACTCLGFTVIRKKPFTEAKTSWMMCTLLPVVFNGQAWDRTRKGARIHSNEYTRIFWNTYHPHSPGKGPLLVL